MKISNTLPQFKKESALFIVTERHAADLYLAAKGAVTKIGTIVTPKIRYSDKEGFFISGGKGERSSGSALKQVTAFEKTAFLSEFKRKAPAFIKRADDVYLFTPSYMAGEMRMALKACGVVPKKTVSGDYRKQTLFYLLKKIAD